jgi:hypothetical protein
MSDISRPMFFHLLSREHEHVPPCLVWWVLGHVPHEFTLTPYSQHKHDLNTLLISNMDGLRQGAVVYPSSWPRTTVLCRTLPSLPVLVQNLTHFFSGSLSEIKKITFDGCSSFPCVVHHGSHATGQATLVANSTTNSLTCQVAILVTRSTTNIQTCQVAILATRSTTNSRTCQVATLVARSTPTV